MNGDQQGIFSFISYIFADLNKKKIVKILQNSKTPLKLVGSTVRVRIVILKNIIMRLMYFKII